MLVLPPAITEAQEGNELSVAPSCVAALLAVKAAVTQRCWRERKAVLRVNQRRRPALFSECASTKRVRSRAALVRIVRGGSLRQRPATSPAAINEQVSLGYGQPTLIGEHFPRCI